MVCKIFSIDFFSLFFAVCLYAGARAALSSSFPILLLALNWHRSYSPPVLYPVGVALTMLLRSPLFSYSVLSSSLFNLLLTHSLMFHAPPFFFRFPVHAPLIFLACFLAQVCFSELSILLSPLGSSSFSSLCCFLCTSWQHPRSLVL